MAQSKFKEKINNTPHLMTEESLVNIAELLDQQINKEMLDVIGSSKSQVETSYNPDVKLGQINIEGALTYQSEWYQKYYGGTSYESVKEQMDSLVSSGMKTLLLLVSSGGGEAYACFSTGDYLRKLADDNGIKIIAYVDGLSASAAYGLSAIADEIIANPQAEVGSIGVVVRLRNVNEAMQNMGVKDTYVYAGKSKIPYKADGSWSESFISDVQAKVDTLYKEFTSYVATNRSMTVEAVESTEAATYLAKDALELGLIDRVMTHEEFYTYLADDVQKETQSKMFNLNKIKLNSEQEKVKMKELEEAQAELSAIKVKMDVEVKAKAALDVEVVTLKASLEEVTKKLAVFEEAAAKLEADKEALIKAQADAAIAKRKEKLAAVLPADQVEEKLSVLADSSDAVFDIALSGYEAAEKAKHNSPLFNEAGSDNAETPVIDPVKAQVEYNKKRYNK